MQRTRRKRARLGQHFLIHGWAARKLAHAAGAKEGEVILEIGPGKGALTRELLALGPVVAVEKDGALAAGLRATFPQEMSRARLRIIEGDVRDFDPSSIATPYVVAANIPYYITGEIIKRFLTAAHQPRRMALLVQKEVAARIGARDGKESILSLSVKAYGAPRIVERVPRRHFSPPPSVDSAILLIEDISKDFFRDLPEERFFTVVRAGFASKRKKLSTNFSSAFGRQARGAFASCGIGEGIRAEQVALPQWKCLARELIG